MEGPVSKNKDNKVFGFISSTKNYHMFLTDQPRLYLYTELIIPKDDGPPIKQEYVKDILLYDGIKARGLKRNKFEIECKASRKHYQYNSDNAG